MQCLLNKNQSQKLYSFGRFKAIKFICEPFWALLLTQTTDFPPSHILQLLKSLPFHVPEAYKRYPFRAEPPRIGHHSEYPPPPRSEMPTSGDLKSGDSLFFHYLPGISI